MLFRSGAGLVAAGTGEINCANVLKCLEENGYAGLIGFELIPKTTTAQAVRAIARL